jgi:hypothetical protein
VSSAAEMTAEYVRALEEREAAALQAKAKIDTDLHATRAALRHARRAAKAVGADRALPAPKPKATPHANGGKEPRVVVLDILREAGKALTREEIGERKGTKQGLHFTLARMVEDGELRSDNADLDNPRYSLAVAA